MNRNIVTIILLALVLLLGLLWLGDSRSYRSEVKALNQQYRALEKTKNNLDKEFVTLKRIRAKDSLELDNARKQTLSAQKSARNYQSKYLRAKSELLIAMDTLETP